MTWTLSGQILGVSERLAWESCSHAYGHSTDLGHALGGATMIRYLTCVDRALLVMLIAFVVAALGGCETPISRQAWVRDGAIDADLKRDTYECRREATYVNWRRINWRWSDTDADSKLYRLCMEARGWTRAE